MTPGPGHNSTPASFAKDQATDAPWKTDPATGHESVLGPDGVLVADCAIMVNPRYGKRTPESNRANARLCAAAPDLLAAAKSILEDWAPSYLSKGDIAMLEEAISKAESPRQ